MPNSEQAVVCDRRAVALDDVFFIFFFYGSRDSLKVERRTRDRKVASSSPSRSGGIIFCSRVNFLC